MVVRHRTRSSVCFQSDWSHVDTWFPWLNTQGTLFLTDESMSNDSVHPGFFSPGGKSVDNGGGFDLISDTIINIVPASLSNEAVGRFLESGKVIPLYMAGGIPADGDGPLGAVSDLDLLGFGGTAIARTRPTNPSFSLSRAIGELRKDGLPSLIGLEAVKDTTRALKDARLGRLSKSTHARRLGGSAGNEYLNVQFGWAPIVNDLVGLARTVKRTNKIISQYHKGSDSKIKRRYAFPSNTTSYTKTGGCFVQPHVYMDEMWSGVQTVTSQQETSFSGAFRYHVPLGDDFLSKMAVWESEANKLLGLRLTPKLVWDLAPWTWAVGWFSNVGDVISNISSLGADGLLLQYGYVMGGTITKDHIIAKRGNFTCEATWCHKDLKRRTARWWGFDFDVSALSPAQDAVIVALGLSHGLR